MYDVVHCYLDGRELRRQLVNVTENVKCSHCQERLLEEDAKGHITDMGKLFRFASAEPNKPAKTLPGLYCSTDCLVRSRATLKS